MSESNNPVVPTILPVPTMPETDKGYGLDLQRRFDREDQGAAIEVLTHRRRQSLEKAIKSRNKTLTDLRKLATEQGEAINTNVIEHIEKLEFDDYTNAAQALVDAGLGTYAAAVKTVNRNDKDSYVNYVVVVARLASIAEEERVVIKDTRQIANYQTREYVGQQRDIVVPFKDIASLEDNRKKLADTNKKITKLTNELGELQDNLVSLPQFQTELKVHLAEAQLSESERGTKFLDVIEARATEGFEHLLLEDKSEDK